MSDPNWEPHDPEPAAGPRQIPLSWTMRGTRMTVADVAQFLGLTPKRITQLADEFRMTLGRSGLPCIRTDYGRRERLFFSEDVENFRLWRLAKEEARIEWLTTWRSPKAARRG